MRLLPHLHIQYFLLLAVLFSFLAACENQQEEKSFSQISDDPDVQAYFQSFEGRGDQWDDSKPLLPAEALRGFQLEEGLRMDLLASEPLIHQPLELNFDHRGRLWVVQYSQYPYPAGLKVVSTDWHLRAKFDKVPEPPPQGEKGADKITMLEDTDGDGVFDKAVDGITGLNIATGITWGRGHIWVLNPPYLLAYPDADGDCLPDGKPVVHLAGFGLDDTHAIASSLRWGPDGWLYGSQGSTVHSTIRSAGTEDVHFKGQAIWRYHPETEIFEVFAEGGGNTFHVEIDDKGRIYSGHNGGESRGQYYKQGAYYPKNWGKHGALTNPWAFGFFPHMELEGERIRFTHAFLRYGGNGLPDVYQDALIGINPLHNYLQMSTFVSDGSTFKNRDSLKPVQTEDHWFRPVDIKAGPDGGVYLADWYDARLSHVDPRDNWHKSSGRIYRLLGKDVKAEPMPDFSQLSSEALTEMLRHPNRWHRQQALRQFGDRKDRTILPRLEEMIRYESGQTALEALWAIHLSGGWNDNVAILGLNHDDPFVRMWAVRLTGDTRQASASLMKQMITMAGKESHPEVRSQLACSAKRIENPQSVDLIRALILHQEDIDDPHNPLLIWWALEAKAEPYRREVVALLREKSLWQNRIVNKVLLQRIMQRYIMAGGEENLASAHQLLLLAPNPQLARPLLNGLDEGLRGKDLSSLPSDMLSLVKQYRKSLGESNLVLDLKNGTSGALEQALKIIGTESTLTGERIELIHALGERQYEGVVPALLPLVRNQQISTAIRQASIKALERYPLPEVGEKIVQWYPDLLRADPALKRAALDLLSGRPEWTKLLLENIAQSKHIHPDDVPEDIRQKIILSGTEANQQQAFVIWPDLIPVISTEKKQKYQQIKTLLTSGAKGNQTTGKSLFRNYCGACHRLFDEGGNIGPDLTGYDRRDTETFLLNIIDPNAEIREGYVNYILQTKDGRIFSGVIESRSGGIISLRNFAGEIISIAEKDLEKTEPQNQSIMPERILDALNEQEIKDLFAYIQSS